MLKLDIIVGARPNFVKAASIISGLEQFGDSENDLNYRIVHTGQHYDDNLSNIFFEQLNIPMPDVNLNVGSGSHARQTSEIMIRYEELLTQEQPELCLVVGDVNSTLACAITAKKMSIKVAHVEAGIRSGDLTMPEEINRIVTDSISDFHFTTSRLASENLHKSGFSDCMVYFVGNTMADTLLRNLHRLQPPGFWAEYQLQLRNYFVVTMHRPATISSEEDFIDLIKFICVCARGLPVIFPAHPRTLPLLNSLKRMPKNLIVVDPQPYLQFNYLVKNCLGVITDSGGISEEATLLDIPCLTLRENTERPETLHIGTNELLGLDRLKIESAFKRLFLGEWKKGKHPEKWDGQAGSRIARTLLGVL